VEPLTDTLSSREVLGLDIARCEWFAVQVWSRREHVSAKHLQLRGYEIFLPCYHDRRRWSDRVKVVDRALFTGYLFCRFDAKVADRLITAPGVISIVGDGSGPLAIPAHEIEAIQRIVDAPYTAEPWPMLHAGQKVRIEVGPLRGIEGVLLRTKNSQRFVVSVSLLQRAVAVEIDSASVTIAHATAAG
jgi:transcriptional antiterminator RfaH